MFISVTFFCQKNIFVCIFRLLPGRGDRTYRSVEALFKETDASVSQVRDNLPGTALADGAFHFVDAGSPENSHKVKRCFDSICGICPNSHFFFVMKANCFF